MYAPSDADIVSVLKPSRSAYFVSIRNRSPAHRPASSPPVPARISTITFLASLGSASTIASRISSSISASRDRAVSSISRTSGSSPSASISCAPASSSTVRRHSSASLCATSSWLYSRPAAARRLRSPITSGSDICACTSAWRASICSTSDSIIRRKRLRGHVQGDPLMFRARRSEEGGGMPSTTPLPKLDTRDLHAYQRALVSASLLICPHRYEHPRPQPAADLPPPVT